MLREHFPTFQGCSLAYMYTQKALQEQSKQSNKFTPSEVIGVCPFQPAMFWSDPSNETYM